MQNSDISRDIGEQLMVIKIVFDAVIGYGGRGGSIAVIPNSNLLL